MNLKQRMTLAISALMVLFAVFMAVVAVGYFERKLNETIIDQQSSLVSYIAGEIDNTLGIAQGLLVASATFVPVDALDSPERTRRFLQSRTSLNKLFGNRLLVISANGRLVATSHTVAGSKPPPNFTDTPFFRETLRKRIPLISEITTCCISPHSSEIVMTAPIFGAGNEVRGVLAGTIALRETNLLSRFGSLRIGKRGYLQLATAGQTLILHPERECILQQVGPLHGDLVADAVTGFSGTRRTVNNRGVPMFTTARKLALKDWVVMANYPEKEVLAPIRAARVVMGITTVAGIGALIVLISLSIRYLTRQLTAFTGHIRGLSEKEGADRRFPVPDTGDEIAALSTAFNEMVTSLDQRTESLRESEERFRSTFEQAAVGIAHVDMDGRFIRLNSRFSDILGYAGHELLGMTVTDITCPEDLESCRVCRQQLLGGKRSCATENRYLRKGGTRVWINQTASVLLDSSGTPKYFIMVIEDISARKGAEEEVRRLNAGLEKRVAERTAEIESVNARLMAEIEQRAQAQEEIGWLNEDLMRQKAALEAANRELEAFSYSVSHDLRAPLRHIAGYGLALREDYGGQLDTQALEYLERMNASARRMEHLIEAMLNLSRLGQGDVMRVSIDMSAMAREIVAELQEAEPDRNAVIAIADGIAANGDPHLMRIVLENLLGNAWKYTNRSLLAEIEFGVLAGGQPVFFVRDNGAGFDMAFADRLFGPFQRLHRDDEFAGTGIGLATVRRIINRHRGRIWAESAPGAGATFYFSI